MDPFVAVAASPFREATLPGRQVGEGRQPLLKMLRELVVSYCRKDRLGRASPHQKQNRIDSHPAPCLGAAHLD